MNTLNLYKKNNNTHSSHKYIYVIYIYKCDIFF